MVLELYLYVLVHNMGRRRRGVETSWPSCIMGSMRKPAFGRGTPPLLGRRAAVFGSVMEKPRGAVENQEAKLAAYFLRGHWCQFEVMRDPVVTSRHRDVRWPTGDTQVCQSRCALTVQRQKARRKLGNSLLNPDSVSHNPMIMRPPIMEKSNISMMALPLFCN